MELSIGSTPTPTPPTPTPTPTQIDNPTALGQPFWLKEVERWTKHTHEQSKARRSAKQAKHWEAKQAKTKHSRARSKALRSAKAKQSTQKREASKALGSEAAKQSTQKRSKAHRSAKAKQSTQKHRSTMNTNHGAAMTIFVGALLATVAMPAKSVGGANDANDMNHHRGGRVRESVNQLEYKGFNLFSWMRWWTRFSDAEWGDYSHGRHGYSAEEWAEYYSDYSLGQWAAWQLEWMSARMVKHLQRMLRRMLRLQIRLARL